jgi:5-deoxy-glucuronate isomerase
VSASRSVHEAELMRMELVVVGEGESFELAPPQGEEAAALLVEGELESAAGRASRSGVFDGRPAAWFLPAGSSLDSVAGPTATVVTFTTKGAGLEAGGAEPVLIDRGRAEKRGRDEWERTVTTLVDPAGCGSQRLIAGLTTHADGGWSSYPPHRHDGSGGEPYFEEIYHYRFEPPTGFGFQGLYADDGLAEARLIRDRDTLTISRGYHPVCAAPGHRFGYFWSLCGPAEHFEPVDDPVHAWVASAA